MALLERIVHFLVFVVAAPFSAIFFVYAGFLYMTSQGDPGKIKTAKGIFVGIVAGFVVALTAWLIITALLNGLEVKDDFNMLEDQNMSGESTG